MDEKFRVSILKIIFLIPLPFAIYFTAVSILYYSTSWHNLIAIFSAISGTLIFIKIFFRSSSKLLSIKNETPLKLYIFPFLIGGIGTYIFCFVLIEIIGFSILKLIESQGGDVHPELKVYVAMVGITLANLWTLPGASLLSWWGVSKGIE